MKTKISTKKQWIKTGGWYGYMEPIDSVCGANNTGNFSDSPCPEDICLNELKQAKQVLRKNRIPFKTVWCQTSNVFCMHGYLVVSKELKSKARDLIQPLIENTRLLYIC